MESITKVVVVAFTFVLIITIGIFAYQQSNLQNYVDFCIEKEGSLWTSDLFGHGSCRFFENGTFSLCDFQNSGGGIIMSECEFLDDDRSDN